MYPGAVWSFTVSAKLGSQPVPADGAILVDPTATLSWTAGSGAVSHSVYLGTDPNAPSLVSQGQTGTAYDPAQLEFGTTISGGWTNSTASTMLVSDGTQDDTDTRHRPELRGWWTFDHDENHIAMTGRQRTPRRFSANRIRYRSLQAHGSS